MAQEFGMSYTAIVDNGGEITLPEALMADLQWRVGDDLEFELGDAGMIVRRLTKGQPET